MMSAAAKEARIAYLRAQLADLNTGIATKKATQDSGHKVVKGYVKRLIAEQLRIAEETRAAVAAELASLLA